MSAIQGTGELSDLLSDFEAEVTDSVSAELLRIGRNVTMQELDYVPFNEEVQPFIEAILLDAAGVTVFDTSFADTAEKQLSTAISDNEIGHWNLIALLGMLQDIGC